MSINNVFLSGLPRSGSTLLGMMLNQHKDICHIGESWYWGSLDPEDAMCTCGAKGCPVLIEINDNVKKIPEILTIGDTVRKLDAILEFGDLGDVEDMKNQIGTSVNGLEKLFDVYRGITKKSFIVDKSNNILLGEYLLKHKNWKVILIMRDPRGILYSNKKASIRHKKDFTLSDKVRNIRNFVDISSGILLGDKKVITMRYEDLCHDTELVLQDICNFLSIEYCPRMLNFRRDRGHILMANRMRFGSDAETREDLGWLDGLTEDEKNMVYQDSAIVNFYNRFGYNLNS